MALLQAANADTKCDVEMCEDIFKLVIELINNLTRILFQLQDQRCLHTFLHHILCQHLLLVAVFCVCDIPILVFEAGNVSYIKCKCCNKMWCRNVWRHLHSWHVSYLTSMFITRISTFGMNMWNILRLTRLFRENLWLQANKVFDPAYGGGGATVQQQTNLE